MPLLVLGILVLIAWRVVETQLDTLPSIILATIFAGWIYCRRHRVFGYVGSCFRDVGQNVINGWAAKRGNHPR